MNKMNYRIRKDVKAQISSFTGSMNEGETQYYAFCIHANGQEIATGMFCNNMHTMEECGPWDYYWDRRTDRCRKYRL